MSAAQTQQAPPQLKFGIDKTVAGDITYLTLHGIIDEGFEGKRVADSVRTRKIVLSLRDVRRFASWGMAEWMNFMRATSNLDVYLVECSTYAVNQINLVTGLLAHAKLVSLYAPYRCGRCGEEFETLLLMPVNRAAIRDIAESERVCATCNGSARMDKYPASVCASLAEKSAFDMDDEVVSFLNARFKYGLTPNLTRFRAFRRVQTGFTYLRLTGNTATLPHEVLAQATDKTTVVDLAGIVFHPSELSQWRAYVQTVLPTVTSLQLLDCPPGFIDKGVLPEDLENKLTVRTFALEYPCTTCNTTTVGILDVAANLEQLAEGTLPNAICPTCRSVLLPPMTEELALLRRLPAREHNAALDRFVLKARSEPSNKLEDCLISRPTKLTKSAAGGSRAMYFAAGLAAIAIGGLTVLAITNWKHGDEPATPAGGSNVVVTPPPPPAPARPDWVLSDVPASSICQEAINRFVCVGVSSYRVSKSDGVAEASDAALEELVDTIGLKITDPFFRDNVLTPYSEARRKTRGKLDALDTDRQSTAYAAADEVVRKARRRVVEVLQASGGAAVPAQRSDWYWEEYSVVKGSGTEFLVFVRYDVTLDAVKSLIEKYSTVTQVNGSSAMTAFPGLAWQYGEFGGGAMLTKPSKQLATATLAPQQIVVAVGDQKVADAPALAKHIAEWQKATGDLKLTVEAGDAKPQVVDVKR